MIIRTSKPGAGNKYYIRKANGGYSPCIKGNPTDKDCNVLSNCVGYAVGRFNEASNEGRINFFTSMNAENFFANAYKWGAKTGQEPKQGAIMCWAKGKPGVSSDGAGHVCFVEKVNNSTQVFTSESAYKGTSFYNKTRNKGSNGNWGASSSYSFLGFIYNPNIKNEESGQTTNPTLFKYNVGDKVIFNGQLFGNANGSNPGQTRNNLDATITLRHDGIKPYNINNGLGWVAEADLKLITPIEPENKEDEAMIEEKNKEILELKTQLETKNITLQEKDKLIAERDKSITELNDKITTLEKESISVYSKKIEVEGRYAIDLYKDETILVKK